MSDSPAPAAVSMDAIVALAKRRGFIFQSSEIYGGFNGFFDYGPLGTELKKNIRDCWWDDMVRRRDDIVGLESSIIMHPKVWEASGHVAGFTEPLVGWKVRKQRDRAGQLFFAQVVVLQETDTAVDITIRTPEGVTTFADSSPTTIKKFIGYVSALESERTTEELQEKAEQLKRKKAVRGALVPVEPRDMTQAEEAEN